MFQPIFKERIHCYTLYGIISITLERLTLLFSKLINNWNFKHPMIYYISNDLQNELFILIYLTNQKKQALKMYKYTFKWLLFFTLNWIRSFY